MRFTVVTACYNARATLRSAIDSVRAQRGVEVEQIVVDGGSSDGTLGLLEELAPGGCRSDSCGHTLRWVSERDKGLYDALNKGVRLGTGDVVGILNADDYLEDDRVLADVAMAMNEAGGEGRTDAVYGDIRFVRGESRKTVRYYSSGLWRPWMHAWGYMPAHPSVYVRREIFDRFGFYRVDYSISADFEWMTRVFCRNRLPARYLKRCFVTMRAGGKSNGSLSKMLLLNRENVRANRENGYFSCLAMMLPKYFYKIIGCLVRK